MKIAEVLLTNCSTTIINQLGEHEKKIHLDCKLTYKIGCNRTFIKYVYLSQYMYIMGAVVVLIAW
jgi:hypothetical protein